MRKKRTTNHTRVASNVLTVKCHRRGSLVCRSRRPLVLNGAGFAGVHPTVGQWQFYAGWLQEPVEFWWVVCLSHSNISMMTSRRRVNRWHHCGCRLKLQCGCGLIKGNTSKSCLQIGISMLQKNAAYHSWKSLRSCYICSWYVTTVKHK